MNYQELKNAIIEVIRTNGNEEITGEVLQFVLLEMVSSLGKDFQFAGVATPQTEIIERDDKVAWVLGAGTYENFGIPFTVAVDEIAFVLYNGTYRVQKVKTGVIVDDTLTSEGQNPVKGGAIYAEFDKLRAAGYLFAGVATPSLLPPASLTEKIFYLATQGGAYTNLDNITLTKGINIIRFDGTSWIGESLIAITDEVIDSNVSLITAAGVYSGLSGKVDKADGMVLSQNSYTNTEKSKLGALPTAQELVQMLGGKQDVLTFDTTPTLNSQNPVTSDGIQRAIEAILVLIPSAASALNQLADKSFVNSTVATASATFRGTYNLVSDLSLAVTATHAQIAAALSGAVSGADNNDYCFVQIPTSGDTPTEIRVTERYKFNGEIWAYEYDLNNSGFTAAQWEAINSGITALLVTKLSNLPNATELAALFAGKQNVLTFDNAPVSGSSNPVKSGGIYDAIAAITAVIPSTATSSNKLVDLNALTAYVTGIIGALDASFDLTSADGHVTLKMAQVDGVITTLQILTSDIASAQALATLGGQVSTNADDIAALQALYNALQQSAPQIIEPADTWPVASPSATVIYRVIDRVNTPPQYYSDYMFKADDLTTPVLMATYNNAIDAVPTAGSHNLVESGGVQNELALGAVYDVSAKNPTAGPNYDGKFESLAALLSDANLNTLIPDAYRKGGMSIKFVQSSDNKYVQYRLMSDEWSIDTEDWAIAEEGVYVENPEFVYVKTDKEGKILWAIRADGRIYYGAGVPQQVVDYINEKIAELSLDEYEDIVAFLDDIWQGDKTLQELLNEKVDKVEGKSLIDSEFAASQSVVENPEYMEVETDSEDRILGGRKTDGTKFENMPFETPASRAEYTDNPEWAEVKTDKNGKILEGTRKDGSKYSPTIEEIKKEIHSTKTRIEDITNNGIIHDSIANFNYEEQIEDVSSEFAEFDWSDTDYQEDLMEQLYANFDKLCALYPDYIKKYDPMASADTTQTVTVDGTDYSVVIHAMAAVKSDMANRGFDNYPEYANGIVSPVTKTLDKGDGTTYSVTYDVTPAYKTYVYILDNDDENLFKSFTKKKVLITGGVHGNERFAPANLYIFAKKLCESLDSNSYKIRTAANFCLIPFVNGYGCYHTQRPNGNWVDIGSNFPAYRWAYNTSGLEPKDRWHCVFSGTKPGSEFETNLVISVFNYYKCDFAIDHHNYANTAQQFYNETNTELLKPSIIKTALDLFEALQERYSSYFGVGYKLYLREQSIGEHTATDFACWAEEHLKDAFALTIEVSQCINFNNGVYDANGPKFTVDCANIAYYTLKHELMGLLDLLYKKQN